MTRRLNQQQALMRGRTRALMRALGAVVIWSAIWSAPAAAEVSVLEQFGFAPDEQGIAHCLKTFSVDEDTRQLVDKLVGELGDRDYRVRQRATMRLRSMPVLLREPLEAAARDTNLEVASRARTILRDHSSNEGQTLLRAALHAIIERNVVGLFTDVINAAGSLEQSADWHLAQQAASVTARAADVPAARAALTSATPAVRTCALQMLLRFDRDNARAHIDLLRSDGDDRVKLAAAAALGGLRDRACIDLFIDLLDSDRLTIRVACAAALRAATGEHFGYVPAVSRDNRAEAIARWRQWWAAQGAVAKVNLPVEITSEILLFNGADMSGWEVLAEPGDEAKLVMDDYWKTVRGVMTSTGLRGYLVTKRRFTDYRMTLEWRWPDHDAAGGMRDGGVMLLAGIGGDEGRFLEVQLHDGNAGDLYALGGFAVEPGGHLKTGARSRLADSSEKPLGEWNEMIVEVRDGSLSVRINGVLQNEATQCPREAGRVGIMTEGAPFDIRNFRLLPLDE